MLARDGTRDETRDGTRDETGSAWGYTFIGWTVDCQGTLLTVAARRVSRYAHHRNAWGGEQGAWVARSTRISIVEQSLQDILERILELPRDEVAQDLHRKARALAFSVARWQQLDPSHEERARALEDVIALNIEVIRAKNGTARS